MFNINIPKIVISSRRFIWPAIFASTFSCLCHHKPLNRKSILLAHAESLDELISANPAIHPSDYILQASRWHLDASIAFCNQLLTAYSRALETASLLASDYSILMKASLSVCDPQVEDNLVNLRSEWNRVLSIIDRCEAALNPSLESLRLSISAIFNTDLCMSTTFDETGSTVQNICSMASQSMHYIEQEHTKLKDSRANLVSLWIEITSKHIEANDASS